MRSRGFTLIELLVVLLIIGIVTSLGVIVGLDPDPQAGARREASRLAALLELAADQAALEGQALGVGLGRSGYRFHRLDGDRWVEITDDPLLHAAELPEGLGLALWSEGRPAMLAESPAAPQLMLLPDGEHSAYRLEIRPLAAEPGVAGYRLQAGRFGPPQRTDLAAANQIAGN